VCRMRPDFSYIDKEEAELKAETEMVDEEEDDRKDESKQVTMKFKKKESDKAAAYKKNSHAHLKQLQEAEPWMEMRFFGKDKNSHAHLKQLQEANSWMEIALLWQRGS